MIICGCTGHRPHKLPWGYNEADPRCVKLKALINDIIFDLIENRAVTHFITGMALGFDTWFSEAVLSIMETRPEISVESAIPCLTQSDRWPAKDRERYFRLLKKMGANLNVPEKNKYPIPLVYDETCMERRDRYIANNSCIMVALWDGRPSGTGKTVRMAKENGCEIFRIDPIKLLIEVYSRGDSKHG